MKGFCYGPRQERSQPGRREQDRNMGFQRFADDVYIGGVITEIPNAGDFKRAALSSLHLAWRVSLDAIREYEAYNGVFDAQDDFITYRKYVEGAQTSLANALTLIQQAVEFGLKARIAAVSPFLLIVRDPRDLPSRSSERDVGFSEFRSIDAADLARLHDTVCAERLTPEFRTLWDGLRKQRNALMHMVSPGRDIVRPEDLLLAALRIHGSLFGEVSWPQRRLGAYRGDEGPAVEWGDDDYGRDGPVTLVTSELEVVVRLIPKADCKSLLGFDPGRRHYYCPRCLPLTDTETFRNCEGGVPHFATMTSRSAACSKLQCLVCGETSPIRRGPCPDNECSGTVMADHSKAVGLCLTCGQDEEAVTRRAEQRARYEAARWRPKQSEH